MGDVSLDERAKQEIIRICLEALRRGGDMREENKRTESSGEGVR